MPAPHNAGQAHEGGSREEARDEPPLDQVQIARLPAVFRPVARRKWLAVLVCALLPVVLRLALLPLVPVGQPLITDEYSHLLA